MWLRPGCCWPGRWGRCRSTRPRASDSPCRRAGARRLHGRFPQVEGRIEIDGDGSASHVLQARRQPGGDRRQSALQPVSPAVRASSMPRAIRRSSSSPIRIPRALLHDGGTLHGELRLHGVQRRESFTVVPSPARVPASIATSSPTARCVAAPTASSGWRRRCARRDVHLARAHPRGRAMSAPGRAWLRTRRAACALALACSACMTPVAGAARPRRGGRDSKRATWSTTAAATTSARRHRRCANWRARRSPNRHRRHAAPLRAAARSRQRCAAGADRPDPQRAPQHRPADLHLRRGRRRAAGAGRTARRRRGAACGCGC